MGNVGRSLGSRCDGRRQEGELSDLNHGDETKMDGGREFRFIKKMGYIASRKETREDQRTEKPEPVESNTANSQTLI